MFILVELSLLIIKPSQFELYWHYELWIWAFLMRLKIRVQSNIYICILILNWFSLSCSHWSNRTAWTLTTNGTLSKTMMRGMRKMTQRTWTVASRERSTLSTETLLSNRRRRHNPCARQPRECPFPRDCHGLPKSGRGQGLHQMQWPDTVLLWLVYRDLLFCKKYELFL